MRRKSNSMTRSFINTNGIPISTSISCLTLLLANSLAKSMSKLQKTVVSVDMICSKCKKNVMKLVTEIQGINSIVLDSSKGLATIVGDADPFKIIRQIRKFRKSAEFVSIGPQKEEKKEEKKEVVQYLPATCQKCNVWYVIEDDRYCKIL